jgi:hypothetical protein
VEGIVLMRKGENPDNGDQGIKKGVEKLNGRILPADTKLIPFTTGKT